MASNISTSLIISTYNRSDALEICVKSVLRQSLLPDEIIIADDGSKEDTRELIHQLAASSEGDCECSCTLRSQFRSGG